MVLTSEMLRVTEEIYDGMLIGIEMFIFFEQKTAYEMRISDGSSDVCSSDLLERARSLAERGFISAAGLQRAEQDQRAALAEQNAALARRRTNLIEARAAGRGLFLNNGCSNVQYSTQRLSDLNLAIDRKSTSLNSSH